MAIKSFRHRGLERFFKAGNKAGIQPKHGERVRLILGRLNVATGPQDMNLRVLASTSCKDAERGRGPSGSVGTGA